MLPLPPPDIDHATTYESSRERFADEDYKDRLFLGQGRVLELGVQYHEQAQAKNLNSLPAANDVQPHILGGDMQRLYKQGLLRKNSEARKIYEKIRVSSPFRICPLCLHRNVKTIDHYLPKESYAAYSVLPTNLVPCCRDCNTEKLTFAPDERAESLLHPYYDHIDDSPWLGCELAIQDGIWQPTFYISTEHVDECLRDRLITHMTVLDLFSLYDVEGAREINEVKLQIRKTYANSGAPGVRDFCAETRDSRAVLAANYWRSVLWNAAANTVAFCEADWA